MFASCRWLIRFGLFLLFVLFLSFSSFQLTSATSHYTYTSQTCNGIAAQGVFARIKGTNQLIAGVTIHAEKADGNQVSCPWNGGTAYSTGNCVTGADGGCMIQPINCGSGTGATFKYFGSHPDYTCEDTTKTTANNTDNSAAIVDCTPTLVVKDPTCSVTVKNAAGTTITSAKPGDSVTIDAKMKDRDTGADITPLTIKVKATKDGVNAWFAEETKTNPVTLTKTTPGDGSYTVIASMDQTIINNNDYQAKSCSATLNVVSQAICTWNNTGYNAGDTVSETSGSGECKRTRTCQSDGTWAGGSGGWSAINSCGTVTVSGQVCSQTTSCDTFGNRVCTRDPNCPAATAYCSISPEAVADKSQCGSTCSGLGDNCYCLKFGTSFGGFSTAPTQRNWDFGENVSGGSTDANSPTAVTYRGYEQRGSSYSRTVTSTYVGGTPSSVSCNATVNVPPAGVTPPPSPPPTTLTCLQPTGANQAWWHKDCSCSFDSCNSCVDANTNVVSGTKKPRNVFDQSMTLGNTCWVPATSVSGDQAIHVSFNLDDGSQTAPRSVQQMGHFNIGIFGDGMGIVAGALSHSAPGGWLGVWDGSGIRRSHGYIVRVTPSTGRYRKMSRAVMSTSFGNNFCGKNEHYRATRRITGYPGWSGFCNGPGCAGGNDYGRWTGSTCVDVLDLGGVTPRQNTAANGGGWLVDGPHDPYSKQDYNTATEEWESESWGGDRTSSEDNIWIDTWWKYLEPTCGPWRTTTFTGSTLDLGELEFNTDYLVMEDQDTSDPDIDILAYYRDGGAWQGPIPAVFVPEGVDIDGNPKTGVLRITNVPFSGTVSPNAWDLKFQLSYFDGEATALYSTSPDCPLVTASQRAWYQAVDASLHAGGLVQDRIPSSFLTLTEQAVGGEGVLTCQAVDTGTYVAADRVVTGYSSVPWPAIDTARLTSRTTTPKDSFDALPGRLEHGRVYTVAAASATNGRQFTISGGGTSYIALVNVNGDLNINGDIEISATNDAAVGTGADGPLVITSDTRINAIGAVSYTSAANTPAGATVIALSSAPTDLAKQDEILIINLQGQAGNAANVGQYELKRIADTPLTDRDLGLTEIRLETPLLNGYDGTTQKIVIQRVPQWTDVTINAGARLTADPWDGRKSGVIFFRAKGTLTVNGSIDASQIGFRGGVVGGAAPEQYDGFTGGGGEGYATRNHYGGDGASGAVTGGEGGGGGSGWSGSGGINQGGGGGGHGSNDENQETGGGGGGAAYNGGSGFFASGRLVMGGGASQGAGGGSAGGAKGESTYAAGGVRHGGGGAGMNVQNRGGSGSLGGAGGGIVGIFADTLNVSGSIIADSGQGGTGGSGGTHTYFATGNGGGGSGGQGGTGGSIFIQATAVNLGANAVTAKGGNGGQGGASGIGTAGGAGGVFVAGGEAGRHGEQCTGTCGGGGAGGSAGRRGGAIRIAYARNDGSLVTTPAAEATFGINQAIAGIVFLVNGEITIGPSVTQLDGLFIADTLARQSILTLPSGLSGSPLVVNGMFYGRGGIALYRHRDPTAGPAEQVTYNPVYLTAAGIFPELSKPTTTWQEVEPRAP